MLGLERDGELIEGDDDIDFYVPLRERSKLITRLSENGIFVDSEFPNHTQYFFQVQRIIGGTTVLADFYLFEDIGNGILADKWNFAGTYEKANTTLHVPSKFVYPLRERAFLGFQVNMPKNSRALCKFLYGPMWNEKLRKGAEYRTVIWNNKPLVLVGNFIGARFKIIVKLKSIKKFLVSAFSR